MFSGTCNRPYAISMPGHIKRMIKALTLKSKTVFLIDSVGAALTAILLIAVLKPFHEIFGMPRETLTLLSIVASLLAIYSFSCFVFSDNNRQKLLRTIIVANIAYCILTAGLVIYFYNSLTILGLTYFVGEILIISVLVYIELKIVKANRQNISK